MTADDSKVTIHMVSSLDFFIAKKEDASFAWLESSDTYEKGVTGEDPDEFLKTIDCWVIGSRSYETALELGVFPAPAGTTGSPGNRQGRRPVRTVSRQRRK